MTPSPRPRVSIVIPSHDAAEYLEEAVASAVAQTHPSLEIVIVDDASTDGSLELAHELAGRFAERPIHVVAEHARCSAVARNAGVARAQGEYVINLDADDLLDPRFAETTVAALDADPRAGVAYGSWRFFGERSGSRAPAPWDFARLVEANYIAANSTFRRSAWEQVGGFATDVRYEDWDLWLRFGEAGWTGIPVPEAVFHYRVRSQGQNITNAPRHARIRAEFIHRRPHLYPAALQEWARSTREAAGEPPAPPTFRLPEGGAAEPVPARGVVAVVGEVPGGPAAAPVVAAREAEGIPARVLRAADGASVAMAESLAARAGAEWIIALNPGETCASPWPDLGLAGAIAFADSLGYDAFSAETPDGVDRGLVAWRLGDVRHTVCPVPLLSLTGGDAGESRARLLARSLRDLMVAAAVRGGHGACAPVPEALARWAGRSAGFDAPVAAEVMQAAMAAVEAGGSADDLDVSELSVLVAAARLREAELRARNEPRAASRHRRDALARTLAETAGEAAALALDTRSFSVAIHADELVERPELALAYAAEFPADADATLVVFDTAADPAALEARLMAVAGSARLDAAGAPDVLGVSLQDRGDAHLPFHVDALLATSVPSGPLSELPRFGGADLPALRRLAEQRWAAAAA